MSSKAFRSLVRTAYGGPIARPFGVWGIVRTLLGAWLAAGLAIWGLHAFEMQAYHRGMDRNAALVSRLVRAMPKEWVNTPDGFWRTQITPEQYDALIEVLKDCVNVLPEPVTSGTNEVRR